MSRWVCRAMLALFVLGCAGAVAAQEDNDPKQGDAPASKAPGTYKVKPEKFKITVTVNGIFEAAQATEISLQPEAWSAFKVTEAVPAGTLVAQGDVLVSLDTEKIAEQIRDLEAGQKLAELTLVLAEEELELFKLSQPMDLEAARRGKRVADEDLARFKEIERDLSERSADESKKSSAYFLEYAEEELKQLQKMYEADDLTEETEEIVLKRAQRRVDSARFYLEQAISSADRSLKLNIPRRAEQVESQARRQTLALDRAELTFPIQMTRKELEVQKLTYERMKAKERLGKLKKDLEQMVVRSPAEGVVYYGRADRGKWTGSETMTKQLRPGGNLSPHQVFMTIVQPQPMSVRVELPEKDLRYLRKGVSGKVEPTAFPDLDLEGKMASRSLIPIKSGIFDATVWLGEGSKTIVPGMACTVKLVPYENPKALTIPKGAYFHDDKDDAKVFVYLVTGDGEHEKRPVVLGKHGAEKVEVTKGLEEGDEILLEKP